MIDIKGQLPEAANTSIFSYLPPETIVALWAPLEIAEQARSYLDRLPEVERHLSAGGGVAAGGERSRGWN